jgi:hypothetical protein
MNLELQTMNINTLLEEISVCESMGTLVKIKKLAKAELTYADPDTKKSVDRLISYKMRLITHKLLKYEMDIDMPKDHWDQVIAENKMNFYDCAIAFFTSVNIPMLTQRLDVDINAIKTTAKIGIGEDKIHHMVDALKSFELQYHYHLLDHNELIKKADKATLGEAV